MEQSTASRLPLYRSHKLVRAALISSISIADTGIGVLALSIPSGENPAHSADIYVTADYMRKHTPHPGGYYVLYADGYESFSPAEAFEEGYTRAVDPSAAGIGWAIKQMQNGARVCRRGWNGKGMFLFLVPGSTFKVNRAPLLGIYPEGTEINYFPHVDIKSVDGRVGPWLASQTDLLAVDWVLAD